MNWLIRMFGFRRRMLPPTGIRPQEPGSLLCRCAHVWLQSDAGSALR
jgi:hypothetical protein